jgi:hypothetical protein
MEEDEGAGFRKLSEGGPSVDLTRIGSDGSIYIQSSPLEAGAGPMRVSAPASNYFKPFEAYNG